MIGGAGPRRAISGLCASNGFGGGGGGCPVAIEPCVAAFEDRPNSGGRGGIGGGAPLRCCGSVAGTGSGRAIKGGSFANIACIMEMNSKTLDLYRILRS